MREILLGIEKLMEQPNSYNAIDSVKGLLFQENREKYMANLKEATQRDAFKSKEDLIKSLKK